MLYRKIGKPVLFRMSAEKAHHLTIGGLRVVGNMPGGAAVLEKIWGTSTDPALSVECFGLHFKNPVGLAAGLDKNAEAVTGFASVGFGFMEVGTVTPKPQPGNELPRLFRLPEDEALINRMGFNNVGTAAMAKNLENTSIRNIPLGINIGKNKLTPNEQAESDYRECIKELYRYGDFFVVNISSPNTPGLRNLQHGDDLRQLLTAVKEEMALQQSRHGGKDKPILVKIAPDLTEDDLGYTVETIVNCGMSGVIATNTTISRNQLKSSNAAESGGLSGKPLKIRSTEVIRSIYRITRGSIPIIGCGGIFTAEDAYEKIRAGASLVEIYTSLIYQGPEINRQLQQGLKQLLLKDGFTHVSQAVGFDCKPTSHSVTNPNSAL